MATGISSADIIRNVYGMKIKGQIYAQERDEKRRIEQREMAKSEQERKDKLFSQGIELIKAFTPESAEEVRRTADPMFGKLRPTADERRAEREAEQMERGQQLIQSPEGQQFLQAKDMAGLSQYLAENGAISLVDMVKFGIDQERIESTRRLRAIQERALDQLKVPEYAEAYATVNYKLGNARGELESIKGQQKGWLDYQKATKEYNPLFAAKGLTAQKEPNPADYNVTKDFNAELATELADSLTKVVGQLEEEQRTYEKKASKVGIDLAKIAVGGQGEDEIDVLFKGFGFK